MKIADFDNYMNMVDEVCSRCIVPDTNDEDERYSRFCKDCPVMKSVDHYSLEMVDRRKKRGN